MDITFLAHAGSRLQHADQLLAPLREALVVNRDRYSADAWIFAATSLAGLQALVAQARDDALVAHGLATVTNAPKATAQARAVDAYRALADLGDDLESALSALQDVDADAAALTRICRAMSQAVTFLAKAIEDQHLAAGADGRTPVRLATQFTVFAEGVTAGAVPASA